MLRLLLLVICIYITIAGWIYFNQRSLLYFPDADVKSPSEYGLLNVQDLTIKSLDGTNIQLWYQEPKKGMPVVLYLHGNSYNLGQRANRFQELTDIGYGIVAPSYHGFGKSEGKPSRKAILSDARAAVRFLQENGYETEKTIIIGESLGSGVAVAMANEFQFAGVFLITPYTSLTDRAQEIYWYLPAKFLVKDNFVSSDKIDKINAPLLIIHGTKDDMIPHSHSETLIDLANEPKKLIIYEGKGHSNFDNREIFKELTRYFIDDKESDSEKH
ncbi:MAG: alpha/beta fold hydrolase [Candidatus Jidaibacter sp.]|nr:alpha/beta fold hydrolase [Candidatus Jidaibacter sp.]